MAFKEFPKLNMAVVSRASEATAVTPSRRLISAPKTQRIRSDAPELDRALDAVLRADQIDKPGKAISLLLLCGERQVIITGRHRLIPVWDNDP